MPAQSNKNRTQDRPAPVSLNIDTWQREEQLEPYVIIVGGKRYQSEDPMDLDYREVAAAIEGDADVLFRLLFPADADQILANKIPLGAMAKLNSGISTHFGLEDFIAAQS